MSGPKRGFRTRWAWAAVAGLALAAASCGPLGKGNKAYQQGDYPKALEFYQQAEKQSAKDFADPKVAARYTDIKKICAKALHQQALQAADKGDFNAAVSLLKRAQELDPESQDIKDALQSTENTRSERIQKSFTLFAEAGKLDAARNWRESFKSYEQAVKANRNHILARVKRWGADLERTKGEKLFEQAKTHFDNKRFKLALEVFVKCKAQDPFHPLVDASTKKVQEKLQAVDRLFQEGEEALKASKLDKTITALETLLEMYPYHQEAAVTLVSSYLALGQLMDQNSLWANAAIALQKGDGFCKTVGENGEKEPKLDQLKNDIATRTPPLAAKIYVRTTYQVEVVTQDKKGVASQEETLDRGLATAFGRAKAPNTKVNSSRFSALPEERRNRDLSKDVAADPQRFILLVTINNTEVELDKAETALSKEFIDHYITVPNPDYPVAQAEHQNAQTNYDIAMNNWRAQQRNLQSQISGSRNDMIRMIMLTAALGALTQPSRAPVDKALKKLNETPPTVQQPVMATHNYKEVTLTKKATVQASTKMAGQEFDSSQNWEEYETVSCKYFDPPHAKANIPDLPRTLTPDKDLTEQAIKKLAQKVQPVCLQQLREHLVNRYIREGEKNINGSDLLSANENYVNALFVDPVLTRQKVTGEPPPRALSPAEPPQPLAAVPVVLRQIEKLAKEAPAVTGPAASLDKILDYRHEQDQRPLIILAEPRNALDEVRTTEAAIKLSGTVGNAEKVAKILCYNNSREVGSAVTRGVGVVEP